MMPKKKDVADITSEEKEPKSPEEIGALHRRFGKLPEQATANIGGGVRTGGRGHRTKREG